MAGSDYSLRLRATLDTTQVQQELKKLRAAQAMVLDQGGDGTSKGLAGTAHMQKIEVQLTKLNSSIAGLQRAVEQLTRVNKNPPTPQVRQQGGYLPAGLSGKLEKEWLQSKEYQALNVKVRNLLTAKGSALGGNLNDPFLAHRLWGTGQLKELDPAFSQNQYLMQQRNWNSMRRPESQAMKNRALLRQNRQMAALIGGQLIGGAGDLATALGYSDIGRSLGNVGSGVTGGAGAAWSASMAGMSGAAASGIGIVVGLATVIGKNISSMEELAQAVQKTAKAFEENYNSLARQTRGIQDSILGSRHNTRASQLLESGNLEEARKQAKYWQDSYQQAKESFESGDPIAEERRIRNLAERKKRAAEDALNGTNLEWAKSELGETLFKIMGQPGAATRIQEVKNQVDEEAQNQIKEMQNRYKDREAEMNRAKGFAETYQTVVDKLEKDRDDEFKASRLEVDKRLALSQRNDQTIASFRAQGEQNKTQLFADQVLEDKLSSPLDKFNKISEELDKLRQRRNTALEGAYGISREIAGGKMTSEEMTKAMSRQQVFSAEAQNVQGLIGILEQALTNLGDERNLVPDISHLTSLAQYGFNMGEKDDSVERMDKYYSKSLNLQQQIKDKLEEGIKTEAIYN